jgi:hypothetical protein
MGVEQRSRHRQVLFPACAFDQKRTESVVHWGRRVETVYVAL